MQKINFWLPKETQPGESDALGFGTGPFTLRYMEWLARGDPLWSTGSSTKCSVMISRGKTLEKNGCVSVGNRMQQK